MRKSTMLKFVTLLLIPFMAYGQRTHVINADRIKLNGTTITEAEVGYATGTTSNIQSQLNGKVGTSGDESISGVKTFTGKIVASSTASGSHAIPSMTDAQMTAIVGAVAGDLVYNTTLENFQAYDGTEWGEFGGAGGISNWITAEDYAIDDVVIEGGRIYQCNTAHTSTSFASDIANWDEVSKTDLTIASGVLPMANGGTNKNLTPALGGVVYTDAGSMEILAPGTAGQVLQTNGAAAPTWANKSIAARQEGVNPSTTVNPEKIRFPNHQLTEVAAGEFRAETGNENLFANASFEDTVNDFGWWSHSSSGVVNSDDTSVFTDGLKSECQTFTAAPLEMYQDRDTYASTFSSMRPQGFGSIDVKTGITSTPIYVCARLAGSYPSDIPNSPLCRVVDTNDIFRTYDIDFVFGGTSNGYGVTSNGVNVTGTICYDNAKLAAEDRRQVIDQSGVAGESYFAATASCTPTRTSATIGAFSTSATCPGPTIVVQNIGSWQTTDSDLFRQTVNNLPAGTYKATFHFGHVMSTNANNAFAINDGTTTCEGVAGNGGSTAVDGVTVSCTFVYTTAGNRTFEIYGASTSGTISLSGSQTSPRASAKFTLEYSESTTAYSSQCGALCETDFKIRLNTLGAVASDDFDIINGDCVVSGTSNETKTCTFNSNKFSAIPVITVGSCTTGGAGTDQNASISSLSTTGFVVTTRNLNNASSDTGTCLIVSKTGADITLARKIFGSFKDFDYVYVEASSNSSSAIGTPLADIIFEDESIDTRNAYNSSTGVFTVPAGGDGIYSYRAFVLTAPVNLAASQRLFCKALKNGADYSFGTRSNGVGVSQNHSSLVDIEAYLVAGDTLKTQCMTDVSTTLSGVSSGANLTIKRLPGQL